MKKFFSTLGLIFGIITFCLGLYLAFGYNDYEFNGTSTNSYTFGADYYTEQYTATEHAADNILALGNYLKYVFDFTSTACGLIVAAFGVIAASYFGCKIGEDKKKKPAPVYNTYPAFQPAPTPPVNPAPFQPQPVNPQPVAEPVSTPEPEAAPEPVSDTDQPAQ